MSESDPCPTKSHLDCAIPFNGCTWKNGECINSAQAKACAGYNLAVQGSCQPRVGKLLPENVGEGIIDPSHKYSVADVCKNYWDINEIKNDKCLLPYFGVYGYPPGWEHDGDNTGIDNTIPCSRSKDIMCSDYCEGIDVYKTENGGYDAQGYYNGNSRCKNSCENGVKTQNSPPQPPPPKGKIPIPPRSKPDTRAHNKLVGCLMTPGALRTNKNELPPECSVAACMEKKSEGECGNTCSITQGKSQLEGTCREYAATDGRCDNYYEEIDGVKTVCGLSGDGNKCAPSENSCLECCGWFEDGYTGAYKEIGQCCTLQEIDEESYIKGNYFDWTGEKGKSKIFPQPWASAQSGADYRQFPKCYSGGICGGGGQREHHKDCDSAKLCNQNKLFSYYNRDYDNEKPWFDANEAYVQCEGGSDISNCTWPDWGETCNPNTGPRI